MIIQHIIHPAQKYILLLYIYKIIYFFKEILMYCFSFLIKKAVPEGTALYL